MKQTAIFFFLSICIHIHTMESLVEHNLKLANLGVLLEETIFTTSYLCCGYSCLKDAAISVNALAKTNKFLNKTINEDDKALVLIKHISQLFDCSNIDVARALCTQAANKRYTLQRAFLVGWNYPSWNDVEKDINKLHSLGLDLNFSYKKESPTPLIQAVSWQEYGYSNIACWLIENGADINACKPNGVNASMIALAYYNYKVIDALIDHKDFKVNYQDNNNNTPLHCCLRGLFNDTFTGLQIQQNRCSPVYETVKKLLAKGANPIVINKDGMAPLGLAVKSQHKPLIELLEKAIADFNFKKSVNKVL